MKLKMPALIISLAVLFLVGCGTVRVQFLNNMIKIGKSSKITIVDFIFKDAENKYNFNESYIFSRALAGTLTERGYTVEDIDEVNTVTKNLYQKYKNEKITMRDFFLEVGKATEADLIIAGTGKVSMTGSSMFLNRLAFDLIDVKTRKSILYATYGGGGEKSNEVATRLGEELCNKIELMK